MIQRICLPRYLEVGGNATEKLPALLTDLGYNRPLIVSDRVMDSLGNVQYLKDLLTQQDIVSSSYVDTVPEPTEASLLPAVQMMAEGQFDSIIALGGGSVIDSAKAISLLAKYGGKMADYKVPRVITEKATPVIAIPTTAGTGSEMTKVTVITDQHTDEKMLCMGPGLMPVAAIIDFQLTKTAPARVTADTGIDALTHAIEAYVSKKGGLFTGQMALMAMALIGPNLREAVNNPDNDIAKEKIMLGATMAGVAFSNASVALVHGMSRPIGAHFHVPHGMSNAMLLPDITEYSVKEAQAAYAECARAIGLVSHEENDKASVAALLEELAQLNIDLGVPTMSEFGIEKSVFMDLLDTMADQALASGSPGNNPRVPSHDEIVSLYKKVWQ